MVGMGLKMRAPRRPRPADPRGQPHRYNRDRPCEKTRAGRGIASTAIDIQIPTECVNFAGANGPVCSTLEWGDRWAMRSAMGGAVMFGLAFAAEAAIDREWSL